MHRRTARRAHKGDEGAESPGDWLLVRSEPASPARPDTPTLPCLIPAEGSARPPARPADNRQVFGLTGWWDAQDGAFRFLLVVASRSCRPVLMTRFVPVHRCGT